MEVRIDELPGNVDGREWVAIDIEIFTNKGDEHRLHRPTTGRFACVQVAVGETVYVITKEELVPPLLDRIKSATWVFHNGKFDITHLRRWATVSPRKRYFDTMYVERILWNGYFLHFSLAALVRRYFGVYLEKDIRETFQTEPTLTREQLEYAALDAYYTLKVAQEQRKRMTSKEIKVWSDIDRPAVWAFLEFKGFALDVDAWTNLGKEHERMRDEIDANLPLNPRSAQQISKFLTNAGIKHKNTEAETLEGILQKDIPDHVRSILDDILLSRMYSKRAGTYGLNFIEHHLEKDGDAWVVVGDYSVNGAETGRTSCKNPNMQNIPVRDTIVFRKCFIARPGHKLIIADFSSQEPYITAIVSGEPRLLEWINQGKDIYIETGKLIFDKDIKKKDKERDQMKSTVLGGNYGMSKYGLARKLGISVEDADFLIQRTRKLLPVLAAYMDEQRQERTVVETPFGRKIWLNPYNSQAERNALNAPIQGGAGDQMKASLGCLYQEWDQHFFIPFPIVGYIHDELVADVPEEYAPEAQEFIKTTLENKATEMVNGIIRFKVDAHIGDSWADKKG